MTGCQFAKLIAQEKDRIDAGARARLPAIAIFTGIRSEQALAEQLLILARGPRWTLTEEHPEGLTTDDVMVGMEWRIRADYAWIVEFGGYHVSGPSSADEITRRYRTGSYRVTAYRFNPPGIRWEVLVEDLS